MLSGGSFGTIFLIQRWENVVGSTWKSNLVTTTIKLKQIIS